jgi:hypothetical protein
MAAIIPKLAVAPGLLLVLALHCVAQFLLYRHRVVDRSSLPDAVIFYVPCLFAFAGYCWEFHCIARAPLALSIGLAVLATVLSALVSLCAPFNTYGT